MKSDCLVHPQKRDFEDYCKWHIKGYKEVSVIHCSKITPGTGTSGHYMVSNPQDCPCHPTLNVTLDNSGDLIKYWIHNEMPVGN